MLGQSLSRRLGLLHRRTRLIAAGDFSPMPLPDRDDEIRDLTRSVNDMAQRLAQFQQTVRRTERLRLLDQVSGGLAHQLRNGLTGARLAVQLFMQENPDNQGNDALEVALRQLRLLESQLQRFLELGHSGQLEKTPCSLADLVDEAVSLLGPRCRHTGIELVWQTPDSPALVEADAGQLGQVIVNLLGNAIEAAGPGGQVSIEVGQDEIAWLEVCDSGLGPTEVIAEHLFEPFVTGKPEGVGLGLAVSRQVVEAHGGQVTWLRRAGQTCFRVELPPLEASRASHGPGVPDCGVKLER
jgi:signal transduction histidine kinase